MKLSKTKNKYIFEEGYFYRIDNNFIVCIDDRYFLLDNPNTLNKLIKNKQIRIDYERIPNVGLFLIATSILSVGVMAINLFRNFDGTGNKNIFMFLVLLILTFLIHELGHVLILRIFKRKSKSIRFTLAYFIFPALKVDVSKSLELEKIDRVSIYLGGVLFGSLFVNILYFLGISYPITNILALNTLIALVPIYKSDGYNVLIAILSIHDYKMKSNFKITIIKVISTVVIAIYIMLIIYQMLK